MGKESGPVVLFWRRLAGDRPYLKDTNVAQPKGNAKLPEKPFCSHPISPAMILIRPDVCQSAGTDNVGKNWRGPNSRQ
ncbi:MAG: hypothetical protein DMG08_10510 [Acidobacteria bacterium]|nr:MAG: hypothetical protein DMG08_10510 [Acidobacteriota bacterium]